MIFILPWIFLIILLLLRIVRTAKGKAYLRIISRSRKLKFSALSTILLIAAIATTYALHPAELESPPLDEKKEFQKYSASVIKKIEKSGKFIIGSSCNLETPKPELSYILPSIIQSYYEIVEKPTRPILTSISDTLKFDFIGYKQFKNRGARLLKSLEKKLGNRYKIDLASSGTTHTLSIVYQGPDWGNEQLCSLPVLEASIREKTDPALLMSIIRHTSDFNLNFEDRKKNTGILSLDSGEGIEQIFIAAHLLKKYLTDSPTLEDAIANFTPDKDFRNNNVNWKKEPLRRTWVEQVLTDIQFYHHNKLKTDQSTTITTSKHFINSQDNHKESHQLID